MGMRFEFTVKILAGICFLLLVVCSIDIQVSGQVKTRNQRSARAKTTPPQSRDNQDKAAQQFCEEIPHLSLSDCKLLKRHIDNLIGSGITPAQAMHLGMETAAKGESLLSGAEQQELYEIMEQIRSTYSSYDLERLDAVGRKAAEGKSLSTEEIKLGQGLFKKGVNSLPEQTRLRFLELKGKAVRLALRST